jgi:hypothetical protein
VTMGVRNEPADAWRNVMRGPDDACWYWTGSIDSHGYVRFSVAGMSRLAHRVIYEVANDADTHGHLVCHTCDERRCCNPAHLYLGTPAQNSRDMVDRGRAAVGERSARAKLTETQVREIRQMADMGHTQREIAEWFGVTQPNVGYILRRDTWRHL